MTWEDKAERKRNKKAKHREEAGNADLIDVMRTTQGRNVMMQILDMSKMNAKANSNDPNVVMRIEGRRDLGCEIYQWIDEASPGSFLRAMNERAADLNIVEETDEQGDDDADA